jgi:glycosyltransferase involved in cell wall biosynthesis
MSIPAKHGKPISNGNSQFINIKNNSRPETVSAVIPSFNRCHKVGDAIRSVLEQTSPPDEIIVVDDGSTDDTKQVLQSRFGDQVRVIVHDKNQGISAARRTGYLTATGDWIAYLDSDDTWPEESLHRLRSAISSSGPDTVVAFGDMLIFTGRSPDRRHFSSAGFHLDGTASILRPREVVFPVMYPYFQSSLIRRSALIHAKVFEEALRIGEDSLAFAQLSRCGRFVVIPDITCHHDRTGDDELSLHVDEITNPDFAMSRILLIRALNADRKSPFNQNEYAGWVREWIRSREKAGIKAKFGDLTDQFRYKVTLKSLCFIGLSLACRFVSCR